MFCTQTLDSSFLQLLTGVLAESVSEKGNQRSLNHFIEVCTCFCLNIYYQVIIKVAPFKVEKNIKYSYFHQTFCVSLVLSLKYG